MSGIGQKGKNNFELRDIHFDLSALQKVAIAGETGSGKSTLLKIIAGRIQADTGYVALEGEKIKGPLEQLVPGHPKIAYLSQHFELRNHYRVEEELDYVNTLTDDSVNQIFELCQITHLLKRWTTELSGGERQRVSLTRSLLSAPSLLLLDEPYSNLDLQNKQILKRVIHRIGAELKITVLMVSHDANDILPWADALLIIKNGQIVEKGTPKALYERPALRYTAGLLGTYNLLSPEVFPVPEGKSVIARPEDFYITEDGVFAGEIREIRYYGNRFELEVSVKNQLVSIYTTSEAYKPGAAIRFDVNKSKMHLINE